MISYVWTPSSFWEPPFPLVPGNGGTESFTLGQCRELNRRGIANQIITFRLGKEDGRKFSPDINFIDFATPADLPKLDGDVLLATEPLDFDSTKTPFIVVHNPPIVGRTKQFYKKAFTNRRLVTNSRAAAKGWASYLGINERGIGVMYPFADPVFGAQPVPKRQSGPTRVLFAGRFTVEKGIYTLLEALHSFAGDKDFEFTVVLAGQQEAEYPIIEKLVRAHPMLKTVPMQTTSHMMAELMVTQDILVMPSHSVMWHEPFGILSVEAQHAGCRVVASDLGGLPETDCGGLHLFEPDNPMALAKTIRRAGALGRLTPDQRAHAAQIHTARQSVDQLLDILDGNLPVYKP